MSVDVQQLRVSAPRWRGLLEGLRLDWDLIVDRAVARLVTLPSYRRISGEDLRSGVAAGVKVVLEELRSGHRPAEASERSLAVFTELGQRRARQGVDLSDLMHASQAVCDEVIRRARERLTPVPDGDQLLIQLYEHLLGWLDVGLVASAQGHRSVEMERTRHEQQARADLVRALICGRVSEVELRRCALEFRLDPTLDYHAVRARPAPGTDSGSIERYLGGRHAGMRRPGVLALIDGDVCGFVSRLPVDPAPVAVGVSSAVPLSGLEPAFRTASRLLNAALTLGRGGLVDVAALGVEAAVVADDEVGEAMLDRYVRPLEALGPGGALVLDTVARYLGNDARLDTTARELHVHVNTVRYRLGRFEHVTRRSLRSHDTLVEVWWALRRRSLT